MVCKLVTTFYCHASGVSMMDLQDIHNLSLKIGDQLSDVFQKIPGSSILLRYIKSSYQNDPVRSVIEAFLVLFAARYLLAPTYSTQKKSFIKLTDEVFSFIAYNWLRGRCLFIYRKLTNLSKTGLLSLLSLLKQLLKRLRTKNDQ